MEKQPVRASIDATVNDDQLTVEYWRERFPAAFAQYKNLQEAATELGKLDPKFDGIAGYKSLENVKRGIAGLKLTSRAVQLMEQLRPLPAKGKEKSVANRLSRQGLVSPTN